MGGLRAYGTSKMSGINALNPFKVLKNVAPDLPVILMSAYATVEQILEAKQYGAYHDPQQTRDIQAVLAFVSL